MKLYKYRSNSRNTYSELLNKKIWFSSFSELNDPCEGLYVNKSGKEDFDYLMRSIQICCFSKSISSHVLWAHYANSHKGLSYEFDIAGQEVNALMDVVYNNEMPIINEIRKYPIGHAHEGKLEVNINEEGKIFRNKSPEWFYEREVRICAISDELSKKGKLLPFPGRLTGIYFGLRATEDFIGDIKKLLLNESAITFYQARSVDKNYQIIFNQIN